jgi:hypothetical protein
MGEQEEPWNVKQDHNHKLNYTMSVPTFMCGTETWIARTNDETEIKTEGKKLFISITIVLFVFLLPLIITFILFICTYSKTYSINSWGDIATQRLRGEN